jgi:hypothetical protein
MSKVVISLWRTSLRFSILIAFVLQTHLVLRFACPTFNIY